MTEIRDYERYLTYFDRNALSRYRSLAHLYALDEDDMGGTLEIRDSATSLIEEDAWFEVRFGFRRLDDGRLCLAVFHKDIEDLPPKDRQLWEADRIPNPCFQTDDPSFYRWAQRYMEGSWEIEDGPKTLVHRYVLLINALTRQIFGEPLFRAANNALINYPVAENTDAYHKAHLELYRLVGDGMNIKCLTALAQRCGVVLTDPSKTFNSLKEILPAELVQIVHQPLKTCIAARNDNHGIPTDLCTPYPAFQSFHDDLTAIAQGLDVLRTWLEKVLSASAEICLRREDAVSHLLPKIIGKPMPEFKFEELKKAEGKTIRAIEYGVEESHPELHEREGIIIHFTDGSSLGISVGSNAQNIASQYPEFSPSDMHTDLMVFWAPSISADEQNGE